MRVGAQSQIQCGLLYLRYSSGDTFKLPPLLPTEPQSLALRIYICLTFPRRHHYGFKSALRSLPSISMLNY